MSQFQHCPNCKTELTAVLYAKIPPGMEFMPAPFNKPVAHLADGTPLYKFTAFRYRGDGNSRFNYRRGRQQRDRDWDSDPGLSDLGIETFQG